MNEHEEYEGELIIDVTNEVPNENEKRPYSIVEVNNLAMRYVELSRTNRALVDLLHQDIIVEVANCIVTEMQFIENRLNEILKG